QCLPREFCVRVRALMSGALCLSDHIIRTARIRRGTIPASNLGRPIEVPGSAALTDLQNAASLPKRKIDELLRAHRLDLSVIDRLVCKAGSVNIATYEFDGGPLLWRPFVDCGDEIVLALPGMLVSAVRNVILGWSIECNVREQLADLYNKAVWD